MQDVRRGPVIAAVIQTTTMESKNPFETPIGTSGNQPKSVNPRIFLFTIGVHVVSFIIAAVMVGSCFISFAPNVTVAAAQNLILKQLCFYLLILFGVQFYGVALSFFAWRMVKTMGRPPA